MIYDVVEIDGVTERRKEKRARISVSLRNVSRECRKEILRSHGYHAFWLGEISEAHYADLLHSHLYMRESLEQIFDSLNGSFCVSNLYNNEGKVFDLPKYVTTRRNKSDCLRRDINELGACLGVVSNSFLPKAEEIVSYMHTVQKVYSAALLGVLYMLEETVTYAGPRIAAALGKRFDLKGKATHYLRSNEKQKADLWEFRRSLDLITDFQTQANIVIASTITYRMYRDMLDPRVGLMMASSSMFH